VTSLIDPKNVDICRSQLGIHVEVSPAIAPVAERAREAVKEVIEAWSLRPRLAARPLIDLEAERVEEETASHEPSWTRYYRKANSLSFYPVRIHKRSSRKLAVLRLQQPLIRRLTR
jgi:hypothetical protein